MAYRLRRLHPPVVPDVDRHRTRRLATRLPVLGALLDTRDEARRQRDRWRERAHQRKEEIARLQEQIEEMTEQLATARAQTVEPSFATSYERMRRLRRIAQRQHDRLHPIWAHDHKPQGRDLAGRAGVAVPQLLEGPVAPEEFALDHDRPFVVKPVQGSTSRGVKPLLLRSPDRFYDVFADRELDRPEVRAALRAAVDAGRITETFIAEELVPSARPDRYLPDDWKCYVIGGRVELVMQKDSADGTDWRAYRYRWWDRDGADLGPVRAGRHDPHLPPAPDHPALVDAAERVAALVPGPFVRVDLFATAERVIFGEITPHPGADQRFRRDIDLRLGRAMDQAELTASLSTWDGDGPVVG